MTHISEIISTKNVAILGAGMVGLATANRLIELIDEKGNIGEKKFRIDIIAENFLTDTTSDGAGGFFEPDDANITGHSKELVK